MSTTKTKAISDTIETVEHLGALRVQYRVLSRLGTTFRVRLDSGAVELLMSEDSWVRLRTWPDFAWATATATQCLEECYRAYWEEETEVDDRSGIRAR